MKILLVGTGMVALPPVFGGGIESHILSLARGLAQLGHEVHVTSDVRGSSTMDSVSFHPIGSPLDVFPLSLPSAIPAHLIGGLLAALSARRTTTDDRFDIVHAHEEVSAFLLLRMRRRRHKLLFSAHNPFPQFTPFHLPVEQACRALISTATIDLVLRKTDHIITTTEFLRKWLVGSMGLSNTKVSFVPHGVDTDQFRPGLQNAQSVLEKFGVRRPYCLFVGRIDRRKGVDVLVRAFLDFRARARRDFSLVLIGGGPLTAPLRRISRNNDDGKGIMFLGRIPAENLRFLLSEAEMFVLPTLAEAAPLAMVEAMSCGLPIISTDIPVISELAEHDSNALLVPPGDWRALSGLLLRLADDVAYRRKLGSNARKFAEDYLSLSAVANKMSEIYGRLAAG